MSATADRLLLADIGGTYARFALAQGAQGAQGAQPGPVARFAVADHDTPASALRAAIDELASDRRPRQAALAVAGPVTAGRAALTNGDWQFDAERLAAELELDAVHLTNDFSAVAHALPHLGPEDLVSLGGGEGVPGAMLAVLGPGTGLGVSGLLRSEGRQLAIAGEGGHVTLAAADAEEAALLERLRGRFGHVSAERLLSGSGLVALYEALAEADGRASERLTPAEVTERALAESDPHCHGALSRFCALLGGVAGDLALTLGARGGLFVAGGIAPRILPFLQASDFRQRFEDKGRFRAYLEAIPSLVITHKSPALVGLIAVAAQGGA